MTTRMPPVYPDQEWDAGPSPDEDHPPGQFDEGKDFDPDLWEDQGE